MSSDRWQYLDPYTRKYLGQRLEAYDEIMTMTEDIVMIATYYKIAIEDVQRAKNYAFGEGLSTYQFIPDLDMANAWKRMSQGQGTNIDEVLLKHEIFESDLVINQGINQVQAHDLAQEKYPWSELIRKTGELPQ